MNMQLAQYPFLRIAIPLILGNAMSLFGITWHLFCLTAIFSIAFLIWYAAIRNPLRKYKLNNYYPIPLFLLILSLGGFTALIGKPDTINSKFIDSPIFITIKIDDAIHGNVTLNTIASTKINGKEEKLSIIFQGNDYSIKPGSIIRCRTTLERIIPSTVPYSFNYAKYMNSKGIMYRGFVKDNDYLIIGRNDNIFTAAYSIRRSFIDKIFLCGFSDDTANFLITVITGDSQFIDEKTKISFSHSGLAHILAVSGLHIAIIFTILTFAFSILDKMKLKWLRLIISLIMIWIFCFITGLSPSAIRASIMTSFLIIALLSLNKHSITNSLAASAVFTLLFDPLAITDIGFQLSYLSVAGIILLANSMTIGKRFSLKKKITGLFAVSIAAQSGTCFISIMYFNVFPLAFIIANIIAVPILPFFFIISIFTILLSVVGVQFDIMTASVDSLYYGIMRVADFCSGLEVLTFDNIWLTPIAATSFTLVIVFFGLWLRNRKEMLILWAASACAVVAFSDLIYQICNTPQHGYFISDEYESTNLVILENKELLIINSNNDSTEINYFISRQKPLLCRLGINRASHITGNFRNEKVSYSNNHTYINGETFLFARGNYRQKKTYQKRMHIDYAIITNRFYGSINDIEKTYKIGTYILPKEIYKDKRHQLARELKSLGKNYIDMSKGGKCEKGF